MKIQENVNLNTFNTFLVSAFARYFCSVGSIENLLELLDTKTWDENEHYVLGRGSNTLFVNDLERLVIKNDIVGLEIIEEDEQYIAVRVGGGEDWHHLVVWSVDQGLWGLENLALIPGTVGASPVQNIGAYGVEVQNTITEVEVVDLQTKEIKRFTNKECDFSYRNSHFKNNLGKYFITHVNFRLSKQGKPNIAYGAISDELTSRGITDPTSHDMAEIVVAIRDTKLPRVGDLGTAGSFFKNPIVDIEKAEALQKEHPEMKQYPVEDGVKISAGWLIEQIGYKGKQVGQVGTYEKHALVLVNHGGASGKEVWSFAQEIIKKVDESFGIVLEPEINIID